MCERARGGDESALRLSAVDDDDVDDDDDDDWIPTFAVFFAPAVAAAAPTETRFGMLKEG